MNKKLALLMIPLMLMPLMAYGYAHFTDEVVKKYKIHVGSVFLNVTGFHVDAVRMPDVNQDGKLFHDTPLAGDELNITIFEADDCRWYVEITADPISGGFYLNTTMWMHNGGKLPFTLTWDVKWDNSTGDPCFEVPPAKDLTTLPRPPWSFEIEVYKWHFNTTTNEYERTGPWSTTETEYKPCDYIEVKQHINFKQPGPGETWQKDWQCQWIKLWVTFCAEDVHMDASSWTWGTPGTPVG